MKTIGLIGGLSWESTTVYYNYINRYIQEQLGGLHSAKCLIYSFNFEEIAKLQREGEWKLATNKMIEAAKVLENGGADLIAICTNTMHLMADEVQDAVNVPLIHIVDCVVEEIKKKNLSKVGLLGTRFTMEQPFYKELLINNNIEVLIPEEEDRKVVHDVIFGELCKGINEPASKEAYLNIINKLVERGAEGVILGCTEIPLLIQQNDTSIPLFDTTFIHANKVAQKALNE
ncbi:aspartate/glutamate racemase family protein [Bacillus sp. EB106-08-02-XG196]|jgi:aspartate racemase|uniref:aspartate/glutamate racemase family protein n=1 Tax=Bacillus sp. EB106-08-02-XG196 TaxID=2737049 RepID=UPI0015C44A15|nr:aspartate/glutamate racemase family protein [Bacillus sp. EB106-08-02-XG196]NWQ44639.1 aspartate/glutamate racemase family protein [Bacillus sp. EB106-08-02-XG196]